MANKTFCADFIPENVLAQLGEIHAPTIVGIPPCNAFRDLVQLPTGEIRHYGMRWDTDPPCRVYISSHDCGLSWQRFSASEERPGACVQSPWSGDWLTVVSVRPNSHSPWCFPAALAETPGLYVCRSRDGIDGVFECKKISDVIYGVTRHPLALHQRKRWIVATSVPVGCCPDGQVHPSVLRSDDDGETWQETILETVAPHNVEWPHAGVRWQNDACEATIVELNSGRLWMLMRTSQDWHYESFSDDAGVTWSTPQASRFYGTITMPTLFRMQDGRIVVLWCNTTPLPEVDHDTQPELTEQERQGRWEDVFTNRDALHAAISEDDGETWIGFRELILNERRNDADFRSSGGNRDTLDKSVHQTQVLELPEGKLLVSLGQHPYCRKLVIFDPAWLYETERTDDFSGGLGGWSIHQYVKGLAGNFRGITGHCACNRRPGVLLVPHPDGEPREVLQIARHPDPRLLYEKQGAVWNFPAGKSGALRLRLRLVEGGQGVRLCLLDRWFNPVDPVAQHFAQYVLEIDAVGRINGEQALHVGEWQDIAVRWKDAATDEAEYRLGDSDVWMSVSLVNPGRNGLSYLHLQSLAENSDPYGVLLQLVTVRVCVPG